MSRQTKSENQIIYICDFRHYEKSSSKKRPTCKFIYFFKLLCKPRKDTMLEVLMFVIARHMIIEHTTAFENLLSIIAISILIIVDRYFLKSKTLN